MAACAPVGGRAGSKVGRVGHRACRDAMPLAADAGALKTEALGLGPVDAAEVVEVFGTRALVAALVRRQQGLAQLGGRLAFDLVESPDLSDHIGQRDTSGEPMRFDQARAEEGSALFVDLMSDGIRGMTPGQTMGANSARYVRFFAGGFRHVFPASSPFLSATASYHLSAVWCSTAHAA